MDGDQDALPTIVVPGPELREKVDMMASRLSKMEKRQSDEMVARVLASGRRAEFLFIDSSHIFYPYFLSKFTEYRNNPELCPDKSKSGSAAPAAAATTTVTQVGRMVRTEGGTTGGDQLEEVRRQAEMEARLYLEDPFPDHYSLDLKGGTIEMQAMIMDLMCCTAQYVAKYGDAFLHAVQTKQKHNPAFRFLQEEDVRYSVFRGLVNSYSRILTFDADDTEKRLELMGSTDYVMETVLSEKVKYAKSALARRKAALLTDDELRAKLNWNFFKVLRSFSLKDLQLDGPIPETARLARRPTRMADPTAADDEEHVEDPTQYSSADPTMAAPNRSIQPPGGAPSFAPVFMSSNLVQTGGVDDARKHSGRGHPQDRSQAPQAPPTSAVTSFITPGMAPPTQPAVNAYLAPGVAPPSQPAANAFLAPGATPPTQPSAHAYIGPGMTPPMPKDPTQAP